MRKIPVFRSIARAYGFGFGHFGTALTVCWLPYVIIIAAGFLLLPPAVGSLLHGFVDWLPQAPETMTDVQKEQFETQFALVFANVYRQIIIFGLICMFMRAMIAVGLTRASIGLEESGFYYFSLGAQVWKLFGARLATFLIVYAAQVVLAFIGIVIGLIVCLPLIKFSLGAAIVAGVLIYLAILCGVLYISMRLNFFLPPIVVSEKKLDLLRSWNLSEGNVWRIFGIYLALLPPLIVLLAVSGSAWLIAAFYFVPRLLPLPARIVDSADWPVIVQLTDAALPWVPVLLAAAFLLHVLCAAMLYAATARAYRGVVATDIASQTERE